jgi:Raf kinase inhibitor-like YbhB/YbcL family protein
MPTPLDSDVQQIGGLELTSPAFADGEQLPDSTGYANDNASPPLDIRGVPTAAEALVLVLDDPDAQSVVGHTWDHWLVWDIQPDVERVSDDWDPAIAGGIEGYNDYAEQGYGGPSPPEGTHEYRFKLLALDSRLDMPPQTRKARLGSAISMNTEILAATQLVGRYDASQGTAF